MNTALQQSTVRLTWDETDPKRVESTMRQFTKDDLENMDFKDYIGKIVFNVDEKLISIFHCLPSSVELNFFV